MSIPSITIRLDFGEGGVSEATLHQGSAPVPVDLASFGASAAGGGMPTPTGDPTAAAAQAAAPTPSVGALDPGLAAVGEPPEPSPDIPGLDQGAAGGGEDMPIPEGDPSEKKTSRK